MSMDGFRWRCAICDDDTGTSQEVQNAHDTLSAMGLEVRSLGFLADVATHAEWLAHCDLALVDLNWANPGGNEECKSVILDDLAGRRIPPKELAATWIEAIESWIGDGPTPDTIGWPRARIVEDDVGLWISSVLSWLNADMIIQWWTGAQIAVSGTLAAIGSSCDHRTRVLPKANSLESPFGWSLFCKRLEECQLQLLARDDVWEWFIAQCVLPRVLRRSPDTRAAFRVPGKGVVAFTEAAVFPQIIAQDGSESAASVYVLELYQRLMRRRMPAANSIEEEQLQSILHALKRGSLQDAKHYARYVPRTMWGLAAKIDECIAQGQESTDAARSLAAEFAALGRTLEPAHPSLHFLGGRLQVGANFQNVAGSVVLPFALSDLDLALRALDDNSQRHNGASGGQVNIVLKAQPDGGVAGLLFCCEWQDNSDGFSTFDKFAEAVCESVSRKGVHRGLPLALLLGLRNGAFRIEVAINKTWECVFSDCKVFAIARSQKEDLPFETLTAECGFGIRWYFHLAGER